MKNEKILPFANETKKLKDDFKRMIDKMPDEDFIDMVFYLMESEFEEDFDEEFEDELEIEDFENPFLEKWSILDVQNAKRLVLIQSKLLMKFMMQQKKNHKLIAITVKVTVRLQFITKLQMEKYLKTKLQKNFILRRIYYASIFLCFKKTIREISYNITK